MSDLDVEDPQHLYQEIGLTGDGSDDRLLLAEVHVGQDAAEFLRSDVGRYLVGRANQQIKEAENALKITSPWRRRRIQKLQNDAAVAEQFKRWLIECINSAHVAFQELDRRRSEENG